MKKLLFKPFEYYSESKLLIVGTIGFGVSIYHDIKATDAVLIIPGAAVAWNKSTIHENGFDNVSFTGVTYGLSATVKFNKFYITPILSFSKGNSTFSLGFGLLFPK